MTDTDRTRVYGTRVLYTDPDGKLQLGTTQNAPEGTAPADCAVVRFDAVPFTFVVPLAVLRALSEDDELDLVRAMNHATFAVVRTELDSIHEKLNHSLSRIGKRRTVARVAATELRHDDVPGYDETWTITIRAKSMTPRGL